ncbi:hypothetical protein PF008_g17813 [Phytophthora fragariae]|uniref:Uncharacterized protein n=1 Tax=Phytophthora fragariae TaxID=53985 RepID=A0A6G0R8B1_9STRA|nr:hypothetical protein PF008_g17813 [Phytophthora fragariae]
MPTEEVGMVAETEEAMRAVTRQKEGGQGVRDNAEPETSGPSLDVTVPEHEERVPTGVLSPRPEPKVTSASGVGSDTSTLAATVRGTGTSVDPPVTKAQAAETEAVVGATTAGEAVETDMVLLPKHTEVQSRRTRRTERRMEVENASRPQTRAAKRLADEEERRRREGMAAPSSHQDGPADAAVATNDEGSATHIQPMHTLATPVETGAMQHTTDAGGPPAPVRGPPKSSEEPGRPRVERDGTITTPTPTGGRAVGTTTMTRLEADATTKRGRQRVPPVAERRDDAVSDVGSRVRRQMQTSEVVSSKDKPRQRSTKTGKGAEPAGKAPPRTSGSKGRETIRGGDDQGRGTRRNDEGGEAASPTEEIERLGERPPSEPTLQLTDGEVIEAQQRSRLVQRLVEAGEHQGKKVVTAFGLVLIETGRCG